MFSSIDKIIISELLSNSGSVELSHLNAKYQFLPTSIFDSLERLEGYGLIKWNENSASLTTHADGLLLKLRHSIYRRSNDFKGLPANFSIQSTPQEDFFKPRISKTDMGFTAKISRKRRTLSARD